MINSLTLRAKLTLLCMVPIACALAFGLKLTLERVSAVREFKSFDEAMTLANLLADLNEANSAEQGVAWSYTTTAIDENGIEVVQKVRNAYDRNGAMLDERYQAMSAFRDSINLDNYDPKLKLIIGDVDEVIGAIQSHRARVKQTMDYGEIIAPYVVAREKIQAIYPALLKETSDKELSLKLTAYNVYLDYHNALVQYIGVMIWAHQVADLPPNGYARYESFHRESVTLLKHFRNIASPEIVQQLDEIHNRPDSRWVAEKVAGFLNRNEDWHDFPQDKAIENEFKAKGEGRSEELATILLDLRNEIGEYTHEKIESLARNRNLSAIITLVTIGFSIAITLYFAGAVSRMIMKITEGIATGSAQVSAAARQITQASNTLADSSSTQASSVEETTAMISQILSMTKATAENAKQASEMIQTTSQVLSESTATMDDLNQAMGQISQNSDETKKIMGTINDIAFQTNILALNAAVEAARAGESGAGFAVVADEVRNLAGRSANASENTSKLMEGSNVSILSGAECANRANEAFSNVEERAKEIFRRVSEIDSAAFRQAEAIEEIGLAADKVDRATQSNAASAEECASSATMLHTQAKLLDEHIRHLTEMVNGK